MTSLFEQRFGDKFKDMAAINKRLKEGDERKEWNRKPLDERMNYGFDEGQLLETPNGKRSLAQPIDMDDCECGQRFRDIGVRRTVSQEETKKSENQAIREELDALKNGLEDIKKLIMQNLK